MNYLLFKNLCLLIFCCVTLSVNAQQKADLLVFNAKVYTVDDNFSTVSSFAITDGKIIETGEGSNLRKKYVAANELDAKGKFIFPGFIDCLLYTSPSPRDRQKSRMPSSA